MMKNSETVEIPAPEQIESAAESLSMISDPSRLKIFWALCLGELCIVDIIKLAGLSRPSVSHHLRILKTYGLISVRRKGRVIYYRKSSSEKAGVLYGMMLGAQA